VKENAVQGAAHEKLPPGVPPLASGEDVTQDVFDEIYEQANKMAMIIPGLIKYLRTKSAKQTKQTK